MNGALIVVLESSGVMDTGDVGSVGGQQKRSKTMTRIIVLALIGVFVLMVITRGGHNVLF